MIDLNEVMLHVNNYVQNYDSNIGLQLISQKDSGLEIEVLIFDYEKFLGLSEIAKLIKKALKPYNLTLLSLKLKNKP